MFIEIRIYRAHSRHYQRVQHQYENEMEQWIQKWEEKIEKIGSNSFTCNKNSFVNIMQHTYYVLYMYVLHIVI